LLHRVTLLEGPYVGTRALQIVLQMHPSSTDSSSTSDKQQKEQALKQSHDLIQKLEHHCHSTLPQVNAMFSMAVPVSCKLFSFFVKR